TATAGVKANHKAHASVMFAMPRLRRRKAAESASTGPIQQASITPPPIVSPTCEAHTKSTASRRQIIAKAKGHWKIATGPNCRAGITVGVNDAVMVAFVMVLDRASS